MYDKLKESEKDLRKLELEYKESESKFLELVEDYQEQMGFNKKPVPVLLEQTPTSQ